MRKYLAAISALSLVLVGLSSTASAQEGLVPHPVARSYDISGESIVASKSLSVVDEVSGVKTSFYAPSILSALILRQGDRAVKFDRFDDFIMVQPMPDWVREQGLDTSVFVPPLASSNYRFEILPPGSQDRNVASVAGFAAWADSPELAAEDKTVDAAINRALLGYATACRDEDVHIEGSPIAVGFFHFGLFACGQLKDSPEELAGQMALVIAAVINGREFQWYREWRGAAFAVEDHKTAGPVSAADFQAEFEHLITFASLHGPVPPQDFAASVLVAEQVMASASAQ